MKNLNLEGLVINFSIRPETTQNVNGKLTSQKSAKLAQQSGKEIFRRIVRKVEKWLQIR